MWSGDANATLVSDVAALPPTTALDLGCGEGADAIRLAQRGWHVTAVDVSPTALARGAAQAVALSVAERVRFEQHDLTRSFPAGTYDLVSAQFLRSPIEFPRDRILRAAAGAVAPGGRLLVVAHAAFSPGTPEPPPAVRLPTPEMISRRSRSTSSTGTSNVATSLSEAAFGRAASPRRLSIACSSFGDCRQRLEIAPDEALYRCRRRAAASRPL